MRIYEGGPAYTEEGRGVGLGNFDGVHIGHAALFETLRSACADRGISSMIYTFFNHPNHVLQQKRETPLIITNEQKAKLVEEKGIDELYFEHFDEAYAEMTPRVFTERILVEKLHAKIVVVGHNYTFGRFGSGDAQTLAEFGKEYGFTVYTVPPVRRALGPEGKTVVVSSTILRQLIAEGRMEDYSALTERYYSIPGRVVEGRRVGRTLGFPTANILPRSGFALPESGVYATLTLKSGRLYPSITNIGNNPTFEGVSRVTVETHILDFDGGLYGAEIEVYFLCRMRKEHKFESAEALTAQLRRDVENRRTMPDLAGKG